MPKKKGLLWVNIVLAIIIVVFIGFKYYKQDIRIQYKFNHPPDALFPIIESSFNEKIQLNKLTVLFVFNRNPYLSELEAIEKINHKYMKDIQTAAIFTGKFRVSQPLSFEHRFVRNKRIKLLKNNSTMSEMFFLILKDKRIVYADDQFTLSELVMLIQNNLFPELDYNDYVTSPAELKRKVIGKLKRGAIRLFDIAEEQEKNLVLIPDSKVLFYHTECSPCALKSILSRLKLKTILDGSGQVIIFSALANTTALRKALLEHNIDIPVYADKKDFFGVLTVITKDISEPMEIRFDEITNEKESER